MIVIGGYQLNPNIVWADRDSWSPVSQSVGRTLGGKIIVQSVQLQGGRPITLSTLPDQGWITYEQRSNLLQMAAIAGAVFSLTIGVEVFSVIFRHDEPPAVDLQPIITRSVPIIGDFFYGTIKLLQV